MGQGSSSRKRVCALDLGAARVGVAISDELGIMAHPRGVLDAKPRPKLLDALRDLTREEEIGLVLVGLPLDMRGTEGEAARRARIFAQEIADATACDVELVDERLTTVQAQRALTASGLKGKDARARIDEASAVAILQAWLDRHSSLASGSLVDRDSSLASGSLVDRGSAGVAPPPSAPRPNANESRGPRNKRRR